MPAKNTIKTYQENGFYHIYNRGVEKRTIFLDEKDYRVFLSYFKIYLTPPNFFRPQTKRLKNYSKQLNLLSYCLMPNHFHLQVFQSPKDTINHFMRSLCTKYVRYFNKRYRRTGRLFETAYKAILIHNTSQLLQVNKYVHRNPINIYPNNPLSDYPYSSYKYYLSDVIPPWIKPQIILSNFSPKDPVADYRKFVEESDTNLDLIKDLTLD